MHQVKVNWCLLVAEFLLKLKRHVLNIVVTLYFLIV